MKTKRGHKKSGAIKCAAKTGLTKEVKSWTLLRTELYKRATLSDGPHDKLLHALVSSLYAANFSELE